MAHSSVSSYDYDRTATAPPLTLKRIQEDIEKFERWIGWLHKFLDVTRDMRKLVDDVAQLVQKGDVDTTKIPLKGILRDASPVLADAPRFPWLSYDYEGPQLGRDGGAGPWLDTLRYLYGLAYPLWEGKKAVDAQAVKSLSTSVATLEGSAKSLKARIESDKHVLAKMRNLERQYKTRG